MNFYEQLRSNKRKKTQEMKKQPLCKEYDLKPFTSKQLPVKFLFGLRENGIPKILKTIHKFAHFTIINVNDCLKEVALMKNCKESKQIATMMEMNIPVPIEIIINVLKRKIFLTFSQTQGYMIYGYPLNLRAIRQFRAKIYMNIEVYCLFADFGEFISENLNQGYSDGVGALRREHKSFMDEIKEIRHYYIKKGYWSFIDNI